NGSGSGEGEYEGSGTDVHRKHSKCGVCKYRAECDEDAENVGINENTSMYPVAERQQLNCSQIGPIESVGLGGSLPPCLPFLLPLLLWACNLQLDFNQRHLGMVRAGACVTPLCWWRQLRSEQHNELEVNYPDSFTGVFALASMGPGGWPMGTCCSWREKGGTPYLADRRGMGFQSGPPGKYKNRIPDLSTLLLNIPVKPAVEQPSCTHARIVPLGFQRLSGRVYISALLDPTRRRAAMDHRATTLEADKIHQNRLSSITDDDEEQDAAFTIVRVLDKVAAIVDSVQASQKRIEERHREMEDAIKTIQIDILKLAQAHGNTSYTVNKLLEKTRKVSARVKDVRAQVEKQSANVQKVEDKQEEMLRKNKFRVVIYQEDVPCPSSLTVVKDRTPGENLGVFCPPDDLSSDEEYYIEESRAARFKKSGIRRINNIKKAFSRENLQKTRQNFGKKVDRLRTRIVTPERRERIRQSGERLRQTGIRFKKNISNAAPTKETFKRHKKTKEQAEAESPEGIQESGLDTAVESGDAEPVSEEISYTEVITKVKRDKGGASKGPSQAEEKLVITPDNIMLKPEHIKICILQSYGHGNVIAP
ncbi:hypothetical protein JRQ81_011748, partial [Phrynocephalus forsythii]